MNGKAAKPSRAPRPSRAGEELPPRAEKLRKPPLPHHHAAAAAATGGAGGADDKRRTVAIPAVATNTGNAFPWKIDVNELEFESAIGRGAYCEVFRGKWRGTPVAIKKRA